MTALETHTRIGVLGGGVEGRAVIDWLSSQMGCRRVTVCDSRADLVPPRGVDAQLGPGYLDRLERFEVIFRSPGVPRRLPELLAAEATGVRVTSATREFLHRSPGATVGITGSNGKTTTTSLLAAMLEPQLGARLHVGGNDRTPLLAALDAIATDHVAVLEMSSFQLEDLDRSPDVAVVLNVTPNHLDVHPTFAEYSMAKAQIVRHQRPEDRAVLNRSCDSAWGMRRMTPSQVSAINGDGAQDGACRRDDHLLLVEEGTARPLLRVADLPPWLNPDNVQAAAIVASQLGLSLEQIREAVASFDGVRHRLELVREIGGVRYIDDSASTTPESTINALRSLQIGKTVLLAGGSDKRLELDSLADELSRGGARIVLFGETSGRLRQLVLERSAGKPAATTVEICDGLERAVERARELARPGDAVVLSPGFASFDMFRNAKERGERFRAIVARLD